MHRHSITDSGEQNLTIDIGPLLDVVFILLIFFIVSAVFVQDTGIEVDRPASISQGDAQQQAVLIALSAEGEVWHGGMQIGMAGVTPMLKQQMRKGRSAVIVQADKHSLTEALIQLVDLCKLAGFSQVSVATKSGS
ncbi:Biopolymer transport protein ExbD/TolR [Shewanella piezotolerans WP3]|uniref:Biopolymer transport protein ExbD/TolR n=1 Tax=Shewanella piezotolerans (strain WP3 / JCM 13877) TaxID=225849 RepID=B8CV92_SHEPW|nr:biopolymer transporter ExbD [Shewanella piezotolerans]ACJ31568.1 Biopolymer transport protein ExbD/TolR [Shewanella piezotolerans WP3]